MWRAERETEKILSKKRERGCKEVRVCYVKSIYRNREKMLTYREGAKRPVCNVRVIFEGHLNKACETCLGQCHLFNVCYFFDSQVTYVKFNTLYPRGGPTIQHFPSTLPPEKRTLLLFVALGPNGCLHTDKHFNASIYP